MGRSGVSVGGGFGRASMAQVSTALKSALTRTGALCSEPLVRRLDASMNYLEAGRWMRANGFRAYRRARTREEIFDQIGGELRDRRVLYLEFGVFEGASMRYWSQLLRNPASHLHGFDSFHGLPSSWTHAERRGHFSTGGVVPKITDPRVRFFPGWFEDVLPGYRPPPHEHLVLMIDSDVYSSAAVVLRSFSRLIVPGAFIYFDEFQDRFHELRAFDEFIEATALRFRLVAASRELAHVAFQCIA
jgi:hypothetical protein